MSQDAWGGRDGRVTANTAVVTVGTTPVTVLPANTYREGFALYNPGAIAITIGVGAVTPVSTTGPLLVILAAGAYYECPFAFEGAVTAVASGTTTLCTTEFT